MSASRSRAWAGSATASATRPRARSTCPMPCRGDRQRRAVAGSPRPPPADRSGDCERRADRAGLCAFRHMRRLRFAALGNKALSRMEARACRRVAEAGGARCAGGRSDRRTWRGAPPRGLSCAPRRARGSQSRLTPRESFTTWSPLTAALCSHRALPAPLPRPGRWRKRSPTPTSLSTFK